MQKGYKIYLFVIIVTKINICLFRYVYLLVKVPNWYLLKVERSLCKMKKFKDKLRKGSSSHVSKNGANEISLFCF